MPDLVTFPQRLVPVVVLEDAAHAEPLAEALIAGGLPVAEVTLRTSAALEALRMMARRDVMLVGAGTVVTPDQVDAAADAGASYLVSPGLLESVVVRARERGLPIFPGVVTPSEVMAALALGLTTLKFFPAGQFGGVATLKSFASPFGGVRFVPTGGVDQHNLPDYLALPNVAAVGGSWMVSPKLIAAGDFEAISRLTAEAVAIASPATT
ncbi:bifunctional 4-hydroxy-2-oxoglutarate aldolase/2-dehydro-3-deoxy-phosphogluconate aldolase [Aestuariimicrobium sp. T2.26MG-19.2B]|uniref:bifunctional 4-hydroxy-2-oxoglutarate aldolase/2-dehydro-3-deoxy-phosphogluconate aldolase n=1 Tax=Aestuariimicrobium sp. T2.26MG-19.2B TaxID=3040679 RepID=UPI0024779573|nr:bifunctional 4-hydroxy-2-oxoglutarate aldolase/2-dehydro-3-deoxy-phosphogluconate aldolase [Aestuariimicrobium sp. T2.26MG-19.2B]CAI9409778.1 Putative KHG/KDPG aldolase [Aestuariimicrobium sp. T2.26MG-19.2B]